MDRFHPPMNSLVHAAMGLGTAPWPRSLTLPETRRSRRVGLRTAAMTRIVEIRNQSMKRTSTYLSCSGICLTLILCLSATQALSGQDDLFAVPGSLPVQDPALPNVPTAPEGVPNFQAPDTSVSNFDPYIPEQKKEVNERFAGWRQAGQGKTRRPTFSCNVDLG